jgi:hypothetical protein
MANVDSPVTTVRDLISESDVIVDAVIVRSSARLSPDETVLFTEYQLEPLRTLKRTDRAIDPMAPGAAPLIVRRGGGRLIVDGLELVWNSSIYPEPMPGELDECMFFLKYDSEIDSYWPYGGPFGIFPVVNGRVRSLTTEVAQRRGDLDIDVATFTTQMMAWITDLKE